MCKTIKQTVRLQASPEQIYQLLVDSRQHAALTGAKASIGRRVGTPFSLRDGWVSGITVDLAPAQRVVLAWRTQDFPIGIFSLASVQLSATKSGGTELVLTHRGVPKHLIPAVEKDWRSFYWERMKKLQAAT